MASDDGDDKSSGENSGREHSNTGDEESGEGHSDGEDEESGEEQSNGEDEGSGEEHSNGENEVSDSIEAPGTPDFRPVTNGDDEGSGEERSNDGEDEGSGEERGNREDEGSSEEHNSEEDEDSGEEQSDEEDEVSKSQDYPGTPANRPVRMKKAIERFSQMQLQLSPKPFTIKKGNGTRLKDIPNVAYNLSKSKPNDTLQILHTILFGKRTKVHTVKKNIGLFSGYVWDENEEKQRSKVKERIDKCVKDNLLHICKILDIPIRNKKKVKKEDVSAKMLEFLESPHARTDALLSNEEVKGKRKKGKPQSSISLTSVRATSEAPSKKRSKPGEKRSRSGSFENDKEESSENKDDFIDDEETDELSEGEGEEEEETQSKKKDAEVKSKQKARDKNRPSMKTMKESGKKMGERSNNVRIDRPAKSARSTLKSTKKSSTIQKQTKSRKNRSKHWEKRNRFEIDEGGSSQSQDDFIEDEENVEVSEGDSGKETRSEEKDEEVESKPKVKDKRPSTQFIKESGRKMGEISNNVRKDRPAKSAKSTSRSTKKKQINSSKRQSKPGEQRNRAKRVKNDEGESSDNKDDSVEDEEHDNVSREESGEGTPSEEEDEKVEAVQNARDKRPSTKFIKQSGRKLEERSDNVRKDRPSKSVKSTLRSIKKKSTPAKKKQTISSKRQSQSGEQRKHAKSVKTDEGESLENRDDEYERHDNVSGDESGEGTQSEEQDEEVKPKQKAIGKKRPSTMTIKKSDKKPEGGSKNVKIDRVAKSPKSTSRFTTDKASGSTSKSKVSSSKKQKVQKDNEVGGLVLKEKTANKKQSNKSSTKDRGKGKAKSEPSTEEIHEAMPDLLAEFDLKVANYYDLYRKLGEHFGVDLMHRKKEKGNICSSHGGNGR